jgi:hypothetical protein
MKRGISILTLTVGFCLTASAFGQNNDFLADYSSLKKLDGAQFVDRIFKAPNMEQRLADYKSVIVDQPEIFIAADSKYRGAKGDQLKALADIARLSAIARLEAGGFNVVDEPSADTIYMRWAITDLYLKKKKRGILSYTPLGMVVHATKSAATRDLWKKIDIVELNLEVEYTDVVTGEVLAAVVTHQQGFRKQKGTKVDVVSWQELEALFDTVGERMSCTLQNTRSPQEDWVQCNKIWIEPEK